MLGFDEADAGQARVLHRLHEPLGGKDEAWDATRYEKIGVLPRRLVDVDAADRVGRIGSSGKGSVGR
jgi:hypothetical protein